MVVLSLAITALVAALAAAGGALVLRRRRAAGKRARTARDQPCGGPFLNWVPDRRGGLRLAGDFLPEPEPHPGGATRPQRAGPRRGPRRTG